MHYHTLKIVPVLKLAATLAMASASLSAQTLLLQYNFDGIGTTATNSGSITGADLSFLDSSGSSVDLHSSNGGGVSGRAFDNSASTAMGSAGTGGRAQSSTSVGTSVGSLSSFTITGWFNTDGAVFTNGAKLFSMASSGAGIEVATANSTSNAGRIRLTVNGTATDSSAVTKYDATSTWVFFAVAYDGTLASGNVKFYMGTEASSVSLVSTATLNAGSTVAATGRPVTIGNVVDSNSRPFDGLLDDFRLYGATSGVGGVLDATTLETIRLSSIPEPSTYGLLMGGVVTGFIAFTRKARR